MAESAGAADRPRRRRTRRPDAAAIARAAAAELAALTGRRPETVISIEPSDDDGWQVGIEVVETRRIPESADILATYEMHLDAAGALSSYRRTCRYTRGAVNRSAR